MRVWQRGQEVNRCLLLIGQLGRSTNATPNEELGRSRDGSRAPPLPSVSARSLHIITLPRVCGSVMYILSRSSLPQISCVFEWIKCLTWHIAQTHTCHKLQLITTLCRVYNCLRAKRTRYGVLNEVQMKLLAYRFSSVRRIAALPLCTLLV
jgi:hypothetical protein